MDHSISYPFINHYSTSTLFFEPFIWGISRDLGPQDLLDKFSQASWAKLKRFLEVGGSAKSLGNTRGLCQKAYITFVYVYKSYVMYALLCIWYAQALFWSLFCQSLDPIVVPESFNQSYFSNSWLTKNILHLPLLKFERPFHRTTFHKSAISLRPCLSSSPPSIAATSCSLTMQAPLVAKDHILHFRCYVQLGRAKDAQELFHRLSPEARMKDGRCTLQGTC